jgi:hypothetical protein
MIVIQIPEGQYSFEDGQWTGGNAEVAKGLDGMTDAIHVTPDQGDPTWVIGDTIAKVLRGKVIEYQAPAPTGKVY